MVRFTQRRSRWEIATYCLLVIAIILFIILVAVWHTKNLQLREARVVPCGRRQDKSSKDTPEQNPGVRSIFANLNKTEVNGVLEYMFREYEVPLKKAKNAQLNSSFIYLIELRPPPKADALSYLSNNSASLPIREAKVVLFLGDQNPPVVTELTVGPLPNPAYHRTLNSSKRRNPVPYDLRPFTYMEFSSLFKLIVYKLAMKTNWIFIESYNATLMKCKSQCLTTLMTPVSSAFLPVGRRKLWLTMAYDIEYSSLHPLDFQILVDMTEPDATKWKTELVWYGNQIFNNIDEFISQYKDGIINKSKVKFPTGIDADFSNMKFKGKPFPSESLRGPKQYEPDGPRYRLALNEQAIYYLNWKLHYSVSSSVGLHFFDIRYGGDRIVYELSMQEIVVLYSGHSPAGQVTNFADSAALFGARLKGLMPGYDCPERATFVDSEMYSIHHRKFKKFRRAFCVFEHSNETPLRRHKADDRGKYFYGAVNDDVLIIRTVVTVLNYDYIYDYILYMNGVVEVKVSMAGFLVTAFAFPQEEFYGTKVRPHASANLHNHWFNFKIDLDIGGVNNRYETLDIITENKTTPWSHSGQIYHVQNSIRHHLMYNELEAVYDYNFDKPKYQLFYNNALRGRFDHSKAYRLLVRGMSKSLIPKGVGYENSVSWGRHQMSVTKRKEGEDMSSSYFAIWDARDPVVNFQSYIDDNDSILDEDLVAWVTLGTYHIPHTEDVPIVTTAGNQMKFLLIPHNYFEHDPSMAARTGVYVHPANTSQPSKNVIVERNGEFEDIKCYPIRQGHVDDWNNTDDNVFGI